MFAENVKNLRVGMGFNQARLASELHVSQQTVGSWESGKRMPSPDVLLKIAAYFNVTTDFLLGHEIDPSEEPPIDFDNIFPITRKRYPLLGDIACGEPIFTEEDRESYIESGTDVQADFCLRAKGDSMTGARILDGDIVFIRKMPMVENGSIAAVIIDDEATLKRVYYYPKEKKMVLNAENSKYPPFVYVGEELDHIRILGKAIAFQSDVR